MISATVHITRSGDSKFDKSEIVSIERYLEEVRAILLLGGEIPIAVLRELPPKTD